MSKHRILIIDDDPDICRILKTALDDEYEVILASDGYMGLQKIQACEPDLIILDVRMPKMDGHQLCDAVKKSKKMKNTAVVFLTGHATPEDEFEAFQQGADLYFPKPFDIEELSVKIREIISKIPYREKTLSYKDIMNVE